MAELVSALLPPEAKKLTQQNIGVLELRDSSKSDWSAQLADVLGVSIRWLLTGEGDKHEGVWPFVRVARARWDACDVGDRGYVESAINRALDECERIRAGESPDTRQTEAPRISAAMLDLADRFETIPQDQQRLVWAQLQKVLDDHLIPSEAKRTKSKRSGPPSPQPDADPL